MQFINTRFTNISQLQVALNQVNFIMLSSILPYSNIMILNTNERQGINLELKTNIQNT